jgi:glycerol kinase
MEKLNDLISKMKISENPNPFTSKDLPTLANLLKSGHFKRIAVMAGAGISVNAGIPDFRSKGGLYETLKKKGLPKPEAVFNLSTFQKNPSLFYEVGGELDTSDREPTLTHYFFRLLENKGILMKVFTQNIDSLELRANLSNSKLVQAHGHFNSCRCISCKVEGDIDLMLWHLKEKTVYLCPICQDPVKPDVVFFGEQLPKEFTESVTDLPTADLLIVVGTSLVVYPFASLITMVRKGIPRVYVSKNIENVGNFEFRNNDVPDLAFDLDCDSFFRQLADLCGWGEELDKLIRNESLLGALDFGTGSVRFMVFDKEGTRKAAHQVDLKQHFPAPNMHEQDAEEYLALASECLEAVSKSIDISLLKAIGITNQRETIIAWDKETGLPLHRAIIWDDARTSSICSEFQDKSDLIRSKTGLPVSTYFSSTKIIWLIRNVPSVSEALSSSRCLFGTVETWAIWSLTKEKVHVTDISNASRTMLMNLDGTWDDELLSLFQIPKTSLPKIVSSAEIFGHLASGPLAGVPLSGALGDQQSALLGHRCLDPGSGKCTYGTGAFLLANTGDKPVMSTSGLLTTVYGKFGKRKKIQYALEGAVECAGSAVKWMMNSLGFFNSFEELHRILEDFPDNEGVFCVPALSGIFAPYWNNQATGVFNGLTQHTKKGHLVRAVVEGIAFRTAELVRCIVKDTQVPVLVLSVDGGMTNNHFFMQEQADLAQVQLEIPSEKDITALGAAFCAGIGVGVFANVDCLRKVRKNVEKTVLPRNNDVEGRWKGWDEAIKKCLMNRN